MYLIKESVEELRKFFQNNPETEEVENALNSQARASEESAWCPYMETNQDVPEIMVYDIDTPLEMTKQFSELWKDNEVLGDEIFLKQFIVSAFRQTIDTEEVREQVKEQVEITIPAYIYNF